MLLWKNSDAAPQIKRAAESNARGHETGQWRTPVKIKWKTIIPLGVWLAIHAALAERSLSRTRSEFNSPPSPEWRPAC
jgi:hypothetical protein